MPHPDSNGTNNKAQNGDDLAEDDEKSKQRLDDLKASLEKVDNRTGGTLNSRKPVSGSRQSIGRALRLGTELVAGVAIGGLIGFWLDRLAGTKPIWFIVFFLLGIAAGFLNVFRTARQIQQEQAEQIKQGHLDLGHDLPDDDDE